MEVFIGTIQIFGFQFAPNGWSFCNGNLIAISQNTALFSLLGTTYGGNGMQTFGLPNLQSRTPICQGQGLGLSNRVLGELSGVEQVSILTTNMPVHNHPVTSTLAVSSTISLASVSSNPANVPSPTNSFVGASGGGPGSATIYSDAQGANPVNQSGVNSTLSGNVTIGTAGGSQPLAIMNPYLTLNFSLSLYGIFPSRG